MHFCFRLFCSNFCPPVLSSFLPFFIQYVLTATCLPYYPSPVSSDFCFIFFFLLFFFFTTHITTFISCFPFRKEYLTIWYCCLHFSSIKILYSGSTFIRALLLVFLFYCLMLFVCFCWFFSTLPFN